MKRPSRAAAAPLTGRLTELQRVRNALRKPEPLLILGPVGSGKTELVRAAIADLGRTRQIVYLPYISSPHRFLVDLTRALLVRGHRHLRAVARPGNDFDEWLSQQTSVHLKGLLWMSLETEPRTIVLDGVDGASFPMYRFLQRLYFAKGMALLATARDAVSLGALGRLFWDPRAILHLPPLNHPDAARLFDMSAERFRLRGLDLEELRDKVLESAKGNPGQIVEMCRLASNPRYASGKHIKFAPLRIDVLTKFLG